MDYKPHPAKPDLQRDIMCINRTTSRMLLLTPLLVTPQKRGLQICQIINDVITLDWSDATHSLDVTYTPNQNDSNGTTTLHISVQSDADTHVAMTIDFKCTGHIALDYEPIEWSIEITKKGKTLKDFGPTWGIMAALLRELFIQRYIFCENERIIAQGKIVQPRHYTQHNASKTQEDTWAKLGLIDVIDNIMDPEKYKHHNQ